jgi:hypothetical protein
VGNISRRAAGRLADARVRSKDILEDRGSVASDGVRWTAETHGAAGQCLAVLLPRYY